MVRSIVVRDGDRTFYGKRAAFYGIPLTNEKKIDSFADDLEKRIIRVNNLTKPRSDMFLRLESSGRIMGKKIEVGNEESRLKDDLREALRETSNIHIISEPYEKMIMNFVSRFSKGFLEKNWGLNIYPLGIPNNVLWFDATPFYRLGEKWGELETGEDFDITLKNYKKINNRIDR